MKSFEKVTAFALALALGACGGGAGGKLRPEDASGKKDRSGKEVSKVAAANFNTALDSFAKEDGAGTWSDAKCKEVATKFESASGEQRSASGAELPEALYNAGLAYQRCGNDAAAKEAFNKAAAADRQFHRARAQLALYAFKESANLDGAISELDQVIRDGKFQNVEGLVSLAALQMERNGKTGGPGCSDDLSCALLNLQRAMAIDDSFMPAFNQLALYYLNQARSEVGARKGLVVASGAKKRVNKQRLDLAALVASQAQRKNPNYAPIHNTTGLILVELENYNGAVKAFKKAVQLNPKFFEAQMNYAAVNLSFRGYGEAEKAYRAALGLRPNTYEAHLGLALALRGGINDGNFQKNLAEAQKHLDDAKKLEPNRPEAYYNEAILAQEFVAKRAPNEDATKAEFAKASAQYESFVSKASGMDGFEAAVKRAKERIQDISDTLTFMEESKRMAEEEKRMQAEMKAQEEAAKKAEAEAKKAEEDAKKAEEAKKAEDAKKAEEAKKAEADAKKAEEAKKADDAKKAEEAKKAAEAKKAEDAKKAADAKAAGAAKPAEKAK
jgi:tetratricopeptide (TPR) repeat protein